MGIVYWLLALICSPLPQSDLVAAPCTVRGAEVCCEWAHVVDRYCCPTADDRSCTDDCDDQQRAADTASPLWGAERQCIAAGELLAPSCNARAWRYDGNGVEYYDREPTLWGMVAGW